MAYILAYLITLGTRRPLPCLIPSSNCSNSALKSSARSASWAICAPVRSPAPRGVAANQAADAIAPVNRGTVPIPGGSAPQAPAAAWFGRPSIGRLYRYRIPGGGIVKLTDHKLTRPQEKKNQTSHLVGEPTTISRRSNPASGSRQPGTRLPRLSRDGVDEVDYSPHPSGHPQAAAIYG